jgi:hypothetical protein
MLGDVEPLKIVCYMQFLNGTLCSNSRQSSLQDYLGQPLFFEMVPYVESYGQAFRSCF